MKDVFMEEKRERGSIQQTSTLVSGVLEEGTNPVHELALKYERNQHNKEEEEDFTRQSFEQKERFPLGGKINHSNWTPSKELCTRKTHLSLYITKAMNMSLTSSWWLK